MEDAGRGWRRVVASPLPKEIVELDSVKAVLGQGIVVITVGGGGIPVVDTGNGEYRGIAAVIDKDYACSLLARELRIPDRIGAGREAHQRIGADRHRLELFPFGVGVGIGRQDLVDRGVAEQCRHHAVVRGGLAAALDAELKPIAEMESLIYERTGAQPGTIGGWFKMNPKVDDIPENLSVTHRGVRLLRLGTVRGGGAGCGGAGPSG